MVKSKHLWNFIRSYLQRNTLHLIDKGGQILLGRWSAHAAAIVSQIEGGRLQHMLQNVLYGLCKREQSALRDDNGIDGRGHFRELLQIGNFGCINERIQLKDIV